MDVSGRRNGWRLLADVNSGKITRSMQNAKNFNISSDPVKSDIGSDDQMTNARGDIVTGHPEIRMFRKQHPSLVDPVQHRMAVGLSFAM